MVGENRLATSAFANIPDMHDWLYHLDYQIDLFTNNQPLDIFASFLFPLSDWYNGDISSDVLSDQLFYDVRSEYVALIVRPMLG